MLLELPLNVFFKHVFKAALRNSPNCYKLHTFSSKNSISLNHLQITEDCTSTTNGLQIYYRCKKMNRLGSLSHSMTELWNTKSSQQVFDSQQSRRVQNMSAASGTPPHRLLSMLQRYMDLRGNCSQKSSQKNYQGY